MGEHQLLTTDDAKFLHACRLLHAALCEDLELRRVVVHAERDLVLLTIHPKRGRQQNKSGCRRRPNESIPSARKAPVRSVLKEMTNLCRSRRREVRVPLPALWCMAPAHTS
jgi:hypothetical protein